jgi:hypothetical protein
LNEIIKGLKHLTQKALAIDSEIPVPLRSKEWKQVSRNQYVEMCKKLFHHKKGIQKTSLIYR